MTAPASSPAPWSARIAAVLGPLLVVGGFLLLTMGGEEERSEDPLLLEIEEAIEAADPEVLFLGSSLVGRAVDAEAMAGLLGARTHVLWRSNASTPQWYAMLKNRAYGTDASPKLVVVASTLRRMLTTEPRGERQRTNLLQQLGEYEPLIERKAFGRDVQDSPLARLRYRRTLLKDRILDGVKGLTVMATSPTAGSIEEGIAEAEPILEGVFGGENARDFRLEARVIPVVDSVLLQEVEETGETVAATENFLPDFVELARANGARVIFVNLPVTADAVVRETPSPEEARSALRQLRTLGAGYLDLSDAEALGLGPEHFRDSTHLNDAGQAIFTAALGLELMVADVLNPASPLPMPVGVGVEASWRREGTVAGLPAVEVVAPEGAGPCRRDLRLGELGELSPAVVGKLRLESPLRVEVDGQPLRVTGKRAKLPDQGCAGLVYFKGQGAEVSLPSAGAGEAFALGVAPEVVLGEGERAAAWLLPGTELTLEIVRPVADEPLGLDLVGTGMGPGEAAPRVGLPGGAERALRRTGNRWYLQEDLACEAETCTVHLEAPAGAPWVAITDVDLRIGDSTLSLLGTGFRQAFETRLNLQGDRGLPPTYAAAPPSLGVRPELEERGAGVGHLEVPTYAFMSNRVIREQTLLNNGTPLVVLEDGEPMALRGCRVVRKELSPGTFCEAKGHVYFVPSDGSHPVEGGRRYTLALREDRISKGRWLYPGDTLSFGLRPNRLTALHGSPTAVEMSIWGFAPVEVRKARGKRAPPPLRVELRSGEAEILSERLPLRELEGGPLRWPLLPGFEARQPVTVELRNPPDSGVFYLVRGTYLLEELGRAAGLEAAP